VDSTAKGEIQYARYVYAHTKDDDTAIRAPVAAFWAMKSHVLRVEADREFMQMCLEFPRFGYDVLSKWSERLLLGVQLNELGLLLTSNSTRTRRETQERA